MHTQTEALQWAGKHASFDMSALWNRFQRIDNDVRETSGLSEFLERVEGDTKG